MTKEEHILIHQGLHRALDILVADMIEHTTKLPSKTSVYELINWSYEQTKNPSMKNGESYDDTTTEASNSR